MTLLNTRNILCNIRQPIPIYFVRQNLDYAKNLQAKYFNGENILFQGKYKSTFFDSSALTNVPEKAIKILIFAWYAIMIWE